MLTAHGLTKVYRGRAVVSDVSFGLEPGTVTAFLGDNGAGKSTTLRMITGLVEPTYGHSRILGRAFAGWPNPSHLVGVLLDASAIHPARTGLAHLRHACRMAGVPTTRADLALDRVGLTGAARARVRTYSLGMRQRLGLAQALLADPPLLMLDEPINGLDPAGIRWIRDLLRAHAERGGAVLVSSHVLSEVERIADRILIINRGRIVADAPADRLRGSPRSLLRGPDMQALADALTAGGVRIAPGPEGQMLADAGPDVVADIAFRAGARITGITEDGNGLEELYFRLSSSGGTR